MSKSQGAGELPSGIADQNVEQRLGSLAFLCSERKISMGALTEIVAAAVTLPAGSDFRLAELEAETELSRGSVHNGIQVLKHLGFLSCEQDNAGRQGKRGGRSLLKYQPTADLLQATQLIPAWSNAVELKKIAQDLQLTTDEALSEVLRVYRSKPA